MNRRDFVSRVTLGGVAAACTSFGGPAHAAPAARSRQRPVRRHDGLRGAGGSLVPRRHARSACASPHDAHAVPDGARGSPIAKAFGMKPAPGVIPAAFDTELDRHRVRRTSSTATSTTRRSKSSPADATRWRIDADEMAHDEPHRAGQARARQHREVGVVDDLAAWRPDRKLVRLTRRAARCGRSAATGSG